MPENDRRKIGTKKFYKRLLHDSGKAELHRGVSATQDDASKKREIAGAKAEPARVAQDATVAKWEKKQVASTTSAADDLFGGPAKPKPAVVAPTNLAAAKAPAAPGKA